MADSETRLQIQIEANTKQAAASLVKLEKEFGLAMGKSTRHVAALDAQFRKMTAVATKAAGLFGVAFSARFLVDFIKKNVEAGAAIADLAVKLGISAEATQELSYAAGQAGVQADALVAAFKGMSKVIVDAERGSKAAKEQLAELGLTLADIKGLSPDKAFELISDKISKMQDPLQKTNELVKFFGKSGADLAPLAFKGAAGIDALREEARKLGVVLSDETIARAKEAEDKIRDIGVAAQAAGINMASGFLDAITSLRDIVTSQGFQDGLSEAAKNVGKFVEFVSKLDPHVLQILLGAAAGYAVGGPVGAAAGGAFAAGNALGNDVINSVAESRGIIAAPKGDRINSGRPVNSPFADENFAPSIKSMPGLAAAAARAGGAGAGGGVIDTAAADAAAAVEKKYKELAATLQLETDNLGKSRREQEIANEVARLGADATDKQKASIEALTGTLFDAKEAQKALNDATELFASLGYDAFQGLISGAKSLEDVLGDLVKRLAEMVLQAALLGQGPLAGIMGTAPTGNGSVGGAFGAIATAAAHAFTGRAAGGPVTGGSPYMVGERGPELFVPHMSGHIAANSNMRGGLLPPIINIINNGAKVEHRQRTSGGRSVIDVVIEAVKGDMSGGGWDGILAGRFGGRPLTRRFSSGV